MPTKLAAAIRAKHPGAYDNIDDATLEKAVLAKYPQYQSLAEPEKPADTGPKVTTQQLAAQGPSAMNATKGEAFKDTLQLAKNNPGATGALMAGALLSPVTGGMSMLPAMAAEGAISAGGALAGHGVKAAATQTVPSLSDVSQDVMGQGAMGMAGPLAGGAMKLVGKGLYRAAALPLAKMAKYGNLIEQGLENAVPVSKSGVAKAGRIAGEAKAAKDTALNAADQKVALRMKSITSDTGAKLARKGEAIADTGSVSPQAGWDDKMATMESRNPYPSPSKADAIKGTFDDRLGGAYKKQRMREALTPDEMFDMESSHSLGDALSAVVPGFKDLNRAKMDAEGLRQMIVRRTGNGSGANQGLENAMTMLGGISAIPARIAMLPPVLSRAAIGTYKTGKGVAEYGANTLRAALVAALSQNQDEQ